MIYEEEYQKKSKTGVQLKSPEKEGLTGYEASYTERNGKRTPKEVGKIQTGEGVLSVGVDRKREVTLAVSKDDSPVLREDSTVLKRDTARELAGRNKKLYSNSHSPYQSAIAIKLSLDKQTYGLEQRIRAAVRQAEGNDVLENTLPFYTHEMSASNVQKGLEEELVQGTEAEISSQRVHEAGEIQKTSGRTVQGEIESHELQRFPGMMTSHWKGQEAQKEPEANVQRASGTEGKKKEPETLNTQSLLHMKQEQGRVRRDLTHLLEQMKRVSKQLEEDLQKEQEQVRSSSIGTRFQDDSGEGDGAELEDEEQPDEK